MFLWLSFLLGACGPKEQPKPLVPEQPKEEVKQPEAQPEVPPEPEPEPEPEGPEANIDLNVKLTYADGTTKEGKVIRVERSKKYNGMTEWLEEERRIKFDVEKGDTMKTFAWTEIKSISIKPGRVPKDVSCSYESDWTPWLYVCVLDTKSTVSTPDGKTWSMDSKYKWKFYFESGEEVEFWAQDHRRLEQDTTEVTMTTENAENRELYAKLQQQLKEDISGAMLIRIDVQ